MKSKMNHREITKKYSELLNKAEFATGRKEVVGLLKKAAKLKSQIEISNWNQLLDLKINLILNVKNFFK